MRELLHGGRVAQQGDERAEHDQRTGGAHALGALGIIRADGDEGGERRAGEQLVIRAGEGEVFGGEHEFFPLAGAQADG